MKTCRDCVTDFNQAYDTWLYDHYLIPDLVEPKMAKRPAPHPGPRCTTHHRVEKKRQSAASHDRMTQRVYGLQPGDYDLILEFQGGRCALCMRATGRTKRLAVDHDHKTGVPRGLLCGPCNQLLGHGRDDPEFFERIIFYLNNPPYKLMKEPK